MHITLPQTVWDGPAATIMDKGEILTQCVSSAVRIPSLLQARELDVFMNLLISSSQSEMTLEFHCVLIFV